jgi:hypothetical protein
MKKNGPTSAASLSVVPAVPVRHIPAKLPPPAHLSPAARDIWLAVVSSRPGEFFDAGSAPVLETFAVSIAEHRRLVAMLEGIDDLDRLAKITRLIDSHAARIGSCAVRLRLTNQSRYNPVKASTLSAQGGTPADRARANYARAGA